MKKKVKITHNLTLQRSKTNILAFILLDIFLHIHDFFLPNNICKVLEHLF